MLQILYTKNSQDNSFYASFSNELGYVSECADTLVELENKVRICMDALYEEELEQTPAVEFVRVSENKFFN